MVERADERGAAPGAPLLDRILSKLASGDYPGGSEVAAAGDSFCAMLREREAAGIEPYSSFLFVFPEATESVSATGADCALNCAHCNGHYLQGMTTAEQLNRRLGEGRGEVPRSLLISGGCDPGGRVPPPPHSLLRQLEEHARLNLHVGLADAAQIAAAARFADAVSFDMVGSDRTIRRVMELEHGFADYLDSFRRLRREVPADVAVVPHIVVGLDGGTIHGEYEILDALAGDEPEAVVFLILRPTPGTRFAGAAPPPPAEVADLLLNARRRLPAAQLHLGCMRPSGNYRAAVDLMAAACDFDVLVQPTRAVRRLLMDTLGRDAVSWADECCALYAGAERPLGRYASLRDFRAQMR